MLTLFRKELNYYVNNVLGYIVIILFAVFANFLFMKDVFVVGSASLRPFFSIIPWLFLVFIPAVVMRSFAEEKKQNTIEVLLTLPLTESQIVIAKFASYFILVLASLLLTFSLPVSFSFLARLYIPEILIGYLGCLFLASSFISVSMYFSVLTKNQIISFLASAFTLFILLGISTELISSLLPKMVQDILIYFSPIYHFQNFIKGIVDLRSVYFFLSITFLFVFLTVVHLEKRD